MSQIYRAKVFKSGNSVALRLPKALGLQEGTEMILREEHGKFAFEPAPVEPKLIDLTGIARSMPGLRPIERYDFEDSARDWHLLEPQGG